MKLLWLNDLENPVPNRVVKPGTLNFTEIHRVKSFGQFKRWITENGLPDFVSFDFDLDENYNHRAMVPLADWYSVNEIRSYNGYDAAKWLVKYCVDTGTNLPYFNCHSEFQKDRDIIEGFLNRYVKTIENAQVNERETA